MLVDALGDPLIKIEEVVDTSKKVNIRNLEEMREHLKRRDGLFQFQLRRMAANSKVPNGWQSFTNNNSLLSKNKIQPTGITTSYSLFTGEDLCTVASMAIIEGLGKISEFRFWLHLMLFDVDMRRENWKNPLHRDNYRVHNIVKITELEHGRRLYVDPTYPQIDHTYAGRTLIIDEEELSDFYRTEFRPRHSMEAINFSEASFDEYLYKRGNRKEYQKLVRTLI